jgi:hypothetical protein
MTAADNPAQRLATKSSSDGSGHCCRRSSQSSNKSSIWAWSSVDIDMTKRSEVAAE